MQSMGCMWLSKFMSINNVTAFLPELNHSFYNVFTLGQPGRRN